jgi:beta-glucosidase-like glycosyl hydrolase
MVVASLQTFHSLCATCRSHRCSYNAESYGEGIYGPGTQNGAIPSCANKGILNDLARAKWGFNGYITSDCGAVGNVQNDHHYTDSPDKTVTAVLTAGMDTDCGGFMSAGTMSKLLPTPSISALVDTALNHLFTVQFRLGFGTPDDKVPWAQYGKEVVNTPEHQQLALEAAQQSLVLLKNEGHGKLPWRPTGKVAVIGRNAQATTNMQGNYFGTVRSAEVPFLLFVLFCFFALLCRDKE